MTTELTALIQRLRIIADDTGIDHELVAQTDIERDCRLAADVLEGLMGEKAALVEVGEAAKGWLARYEDEVRDPSEEEPCKRLVAAVDALISHTPAAPSVPLGRYSAPFQMVGGKLADVPIRFVPREHIHDKPTEANPSPVRVIVVYDLEAAQPDALKQQATAAQQQDEGK